MWKVCVALMLAACGHDPEPGVARALVNGFMGSTVSGTADFQQDAPATYADSVTVTITLTDCVEGKTYSVDIHEGASCDAISLQGNHWDGARGEGIPGVVCDANTETIGTSGRMTYNRRGTDPALAWTVGDGADTDVIGHTVVVHDPDMPMTRIACGKIRAIVAL
jgi:hypothetical protein